MKRKVIGLGIGSAFALGVVVGAYYFFDNEMKLPLRNPDIVGEFQRTEGGELILKPVDRKKSPFAGKTREEIRREMREMSHEEQENKRENMKAFLQDEIRFVLSEEGVAFQNKKRVDIHSLTPLSGARVWIKKNTVDEIEFISLKTHRE